MSDDARIPQDVLDGLQAEIQAKQGMMDDNPDDVADDLGEEINDDEPPIPEDYKTLEEYVAAGGDPDFYRGPKAYAKDKELIGEIKEIKRKLKERDDEMVKLSEYHERERKRLIKEIDEKKAKAKEDLDFEAYEQLDAQRRELEGAEKPQHHGEPPVIQSYRQSNPKLNPAAPEFDPVHASAFAAAFNAMVTDAEKRAGRALNEGEIQRYLDATASRLGGGQPARRAPAVEGTRKPAAKKDPVAALDPAMRRMYDRWMSSGDPVKKKYAENLLKQQGA